MLINLVLTYIFAFNTSLDLRVGLEYVWKYSSKNCSVYSPCGGPNSKVDSNYIIHAKVTYQIPKSDTDRYSDGDYLIEIDVSDSIGKLLCKDYGTINQINGDVYLGSSCGATFPSFNNFHFENHEYAGVDIGLNQYGTEKSALGVNEHRYFAGITSTAITSTKDSLFAIEGVGLVYYKIEKSSRTESHSKLIELVSYDGILIQSNGTGISRRSRNGSVKMGKNNTRFIANGAARQNFVNGKLSLSSIIVLPIRLHRK